MLWNTLDQPSSYIAKDYVESYLDRERSMIRDPDMKLKREQGNM